MGGRKGIDYLGKNWPPTWYPRPDEVPNAGGGKIIDDARKEFYAFAFQRIRPDGTLETLWERPHEIVGRVGEFRIWDWQPEDTGAPPAKRNPDQDGDRYPPTSAPTPAPACSAPP